MGLFNGDANNPQVQITTAKLLELLHTRNSPFPASARYSSKPADKWTADERKEIDTDVCRLISFTEWLMIAYGRLQVDTFIRGILPGSSFLEQQSATVSFQIPKKTVQLLQDKGYFTSEDMLRRLGKESNPGAVSSKATKPNAPLGIIFGVIE